MLTPRQRAFCRHYAETGDKTDAARQAGYSKSRARITGFDLLKNPEVRAEIERLKQKAAEQTSALLAGITAARIEVEDTISGRIKIGEEAMKDAATRRAAYIRLLEENALIAMGQKPLKMVKPLKTEEGWTTVEVETTIREGAVATATLQILIAEMDRLIALQEGRDGAVGKEGDVKVASVLGERLRERAAKRAGQA